MSVRTATAVIVAVAIAIVSFALPPTAAAPSDAVDFGTLIEVEGLVDDYTGRSTRRWTPSLRTRTHRTASPRTS
jgi:hypothetical protein